MAEISMGRQSAKDNKRSRLDHVQQVPDSDTVVSETQLAVDEDGLEHEDLALVAKCSTKKPVGSTPAIPWAATASPQSLFLTRPNSACVQEFSFSTSALSKAPTRSETPAVKPVVYVDTAIPSAEFTLGKSLNQGDVNESSASSSSLQVSTSGALVTESSSSATGATPNHSEDRQQPEGFPLTGALRAEPKQTELPIDLTDPWIVAQPKAQAASTSKKKRKSSKGRRVKRTLLSGPLQPWPPRSDPASGRSNARTDQVDLEPKADAYLTRLPIEDLAVKAPLGRDRTPDRPLQTAEASWPNGELLQNGAANGTPATDREHVHPSSHPKLTCFVGTPASPNADIQQQIARHVLPISTPSEPQDQDQEALRYADMPLKTFEDKSLVSATSVSLRNGPLSSSSAPGPVPSIDLQVHPYKDIGNLVFSHPPSRVATLQDVLRSRPVRITKAQNQTPAMHTPPSKSGATNESSQKRGRMVALENAMETFWDTCLADQIRLENQAALKERLWKVEKSDMQTTMTRQLETITEQRVKLEDLEERFIHLTDKLKSSQRFVSGLQKDHEKLQKFVATFQKQNKSVLQDQIAQILEEKADLQTGFQEMVDSCAKSQKSMLGTMHEVQLRYVTALSRESNLASRLDERVAMHEEEKNRRIALEQHLLPSVQTMQHHLQQSSSVLVEEIGSLRVSIEAFSAGDGRDPVAKECLLILQKLHSLPLLTSKEIYKAENMFRDLHDRIDVGFKEVSKDLQNKPILIEDIRDSMRDQIQGLQAEIVRNDQTTTDGQLAIEANQLLMTKLEAEKLKNQRLEEQAISLRHSGATLKKRSTELEHEKKDLQILVKGHGAQSRQYEQIIAELNAQLSKVHQDLRLSNANVENHGRRYLEQEHQFCTYRRDALAQLANLQERSRHISSQSKAKEHECNVLKQDATQLQVDLGLTQTKNSDLAAKLSQYDSRLTAFKQERDNMIEKERMAQASLRSAEDSSLELKTELHRLSNEFEGARADLRTSKESQQKLTSQCSELQGYISQLQDAKAVSDEQLRQERDHTKTESQQLKINHTASLNALNARLKLSEDARKELQAKSRQAETAHKLQIDDHENNFNAKFDSLATRSQQEQEKLQVKHAQDMQNCKRDAEITIDALRRNADKIAREADAKIKDMAAETERRLEAAGLPTSTTLVSNTRLSEQNQPSSKHSQPGRTRKKINRQTDSVRIVQAYGPGRLTTAEDGSIVDKARFNRRREESDSQIEYFDEEYESRFGSGTSLQDQETQLPPVSPVPEVIPETQDLGYGQGVALQFKMISSQAATNVEPSHAEEVTDLSTISSGDLSEMLMDINSTAGRQQESLEHLSPPNAEQRMPGHLAHDTASDAQSTYVWGRPKSRANTASRMKPLPPQDEQLRRAPEEGPRHQSYAQAERIFRADGIDTPDSTGPSEIFSKHTHVERADHDIRNVPKRKDTGRFDRRGSHKKPCTPNQATNQRSSSTSSSYASYTPAPSSKPDHNNSNISPATVTGRRSSHKKMLTADPHNGTPRLSSTRNTRSKSNHIAARFADELDRC